MKMVMLAIMAVLVLGGGGAGAYFYFNQPVEAASDKDKKEDKKAKEGDEKDTKAAHFVRLDPLILPIVGKNGVSQTVSMVVVIEVPNDKYRETVRSLSPRLKDAYIQDLYGVLNHQAALRNGVVQVAAVKTRLKKITERVLGEKNVKDVLLEVVQQKPM